MTTNRPYWLDRKENVDKIVYALYLACVLVLAADFFVHRHGSFAIEDVPGFYGLYGFVACVGLVLAAKLLRRLLIRPEDYYDRD